MKRYNCTLFINDQSVQTEVLDHASLGQFEGLTQVFPHCHEGKYYIHDLYEMDLQVGPRDIIQVQVEPVVESFTSNEQFTRTLFVSGTAVQKDFNEGVHQGPENGMLELPVNTDDGRLFYIIDLKGEKLPVIEGSFVYCRYDQVNNNRDEVLAQQMESSIKGMKSVDRVIHPATLGNPNLEMIERDNIVEPVMPEPVIETPDPLITALTTVAPICDH